MIRRILVALSGTPFTTVAVQYALELARKHDASVTGVTVANLSAVADVGPIPIGGGAAAAGLAQHRQAITEERIEQTIDQLFVSVGRSVFDECRDLGRLGRKAP